MFIKILKKDLKRSKTMNIILFLFIILATLFVSSGLNNLISVLNGMNYFMDQAVGEKGDYFLMVNQGEDEAGMIKDLDNAKSIKSYGYDKFFAYNGVVKDNDGKKIDWNGQIMIQSPESSYMKFFDSENNEITKVEKGHIYITKKFFNKYGVEPGDKITLKLGKENREYILDGPLKDAALGAELTGGDRFFMNDADAKEYFESDDAKLYNAAFIYIESDDVESINTETKDMEGLEGGYPRSVLVLTRIVELIVAFIVVILSICLIIVSFVILKFSIGFTIQDDFREIGVMKAIGIRNLKIRTLYLVKYTALALIGSVLQYISERYDSIAASWLIHGCANLAINTVGFMLVYDIIK